MFEKFIEVNSRGAGAIRDWKAKTGRKVIAVMPEYFPSEVITALGARPVRFRGAQVPISKADTYLQSFSCTTTRTILEQALNGDMDHVDAFVFTSMCDNQQNLAEVFKRLFPDRPVIIFMIPFTSQIQSRQERLREQLDAAIAGLEKVTGSTFTQDAFGQAKVLHRRRGDLISRLYDVRRRNPGAVSAYGFYSALKAGSFLPVEEHADMLGPLVSRLEKEPARPAEHRVILSGITPEPLDLTKVFDEIGLHVVDDDMTSGGRLYSRGVLPGTDAADIDGFVFGGSPCSTLYDPSKDRRAYLTEKALASGAGVVLWQIKFCEPEAFERPDLMGRLKQSSVPVISFEVELQMAGLEGIKTRLQAFKEIMEEMRRQG
ncbi:MAG: 2-hydroxyacyl-CoA dehydratase family protein [Deltaproteobacteria bacterium]|nr:2-hydroxyacyl-CoA dehydratase family protein [Deltaproteobacteria bacterium]MCL5276689.1 2-hydroxyacyl-CoA dehydratase family protein [Deltaproteobacteria bacterium]